LRSLQLENVNKLGCRAGCNSPGLRLASRKATLEIPKAGRVHSLAEFTAVNDLLNGNHSFDYRAPLRNDLILQIVIAEPETKFIPLERKGEVFFLAAFV
jgi:hypothetical protein